MWKRTHSHTQTHTHVVRCHSAQWFIFLMECKHACTRTNTHTLFTYAGASGWFGSIFCSWRGGQRWLWEQRRWSRPDRPTCAWLYPEPLCRQETTILTLAAASEEPSSAAGGGTTKNWDGAEKRQRRRKEGKNTTGTKQRRSRGWGRAGSRRSCRQWTFRGRASGNSFCERVKSSPPRADGEPEPGLSPCFFQGWRKRPRRQAAPSPLSRRTPTSLLSHLCPRVSELVSQPDIFITLPGKKTTTTNKQTQRGKNKQDPAGVCELMW